MLHAAPTSTNADAVAGIQVDTSFDLIRHRWLDRSAKRAIDVAVAGTALLLLLPLLALLAITIWMGDGKSPIFRHIRLGRSGRPFGCLKFRTMVVDAEATLAAHLADNAEARVEWEATHKLTDDPRVTALGRVLRKTSLDELPQLINVLRGEMSLVGPRPIVQAEVARYGSAFATCFSVPPGVTDCGRSPAGQTRPTRSGSLST